MCHRRGSQTHCGEVNDAGDGDDQEADDNGGDGDIESVLAQPP